MTDLQHGFTCYWRLENFYIDKDSPSCTLESQVFDVLMLRDSTWHLEINHQISEPLSLYLYKDGLANNSNIDIKISILMTNGWIPIAQGPCKGFNPNNPCGHGVTKAIEWDEHIPVNKYLVNGYLTVSCHMCNGDTRNQYGQCVMTSRMISNYRIIHKSLQKYTSLKPSDLLYPQLPEPNTSSTLPAWKSVKSTQTETTEDNNVFNDLEDILKLFKDKKFRYVTLRTHSKDFAVHKALLCARSPVFNAMFQGSMKENVSNVVDINDIDEDILFLMVQFLHLEPIGELKFYDAVRLYYAADKYQIELLKSECRSFLKSGLSDENICDAFIFADTHQDEELQESAQAYFCKHSKIILRSAEWTDLLFNRADLASRILYKLAENL